MKHFYKIFLFLMISTPLLALPVGNPSDPSMLTEGIVWPRLCDDPCISLCDAWSVRFGFYGDYVSNRHLKENEREKQDVIQSARLVTNAAYFALNFYDWVDLFTTLGGSNFDINTSLQSFVNLNNNLSILRLESTTGFSWSIGSRATIWEWGCTTLGGEVQYFCANLTIRKEVIRENTQGFPNSDFTYREWQVGLGLSHRIQMVVPYIAVKWSGVQVNFHRATFIIPSNNVVTMYYLDNARHTGLALGVSFIGCERISFTVEGRFADERAVHVNGQIRF